MQSSIPRIGVLVLLAAVASCSGQKTTTGSSALTLGTNAQSVPSAGGQFSTNVVVSGAWTATSDASWLAIATGGSGAGAGTITYSVAANSGAQRTGRLTVSGGNTSTNLTVSQEGPSATLAVDPTTQTVGASGDSHTVSVTALGSWSAASDVPWLTITNGASGSGNGAVTYAAAPNAGAAARTGRVIVTAGGQTATLTATQSGTALNVDPTSQTVAPAGETRSAAVSASVSWTAISDAPWLTINSGMGSSGNGSITYTAATNSGADRSGHISVSGGGSTATLTVNQAAAPSAAAIILNPTSQTILSGGESRTVAVTAPGAWSASSDAPWLTITSGASGSGNGTIPYSAAANSGAARSGHITVAGGGSSATLTVNQEAAPNTVSITLNPTSQVVASGGESRTVEVMAPGPWSASSDAPWLTITSGALGSGNGTIPYSAAANSGAARSGHITIAGAGSSATLTVNQEAAPNSVSITLNPTSQTIAVGGESRTVAVATPSAWSASSDAPWLTITSGMTGAGSGTIGYTAAANASVLRIAHITVSSGGATATLTVTQNGIQLSLDTTSQAASQPGGSFTVQVTSSSNWTAISDVPWLTITSGSAGGGNGAIAYSVAATTVAARTGHLTVASGGQSAILTVTQETGIVTAKFVWTKTTPTNPGSCEVITFDFHNMSNFIKCRFDASPSGPQSLIAGYEFRVVLPDGTYRGLGTTQIVTDPTTGCGFTPQTSLTLKVRLIVTTTLGATVDSEQEILFLKAGGC